MESKFVMDFLLNLLHAQYLISELLLSSDDDLGGLPRAKR